MLGHMCKLDIEWFKGFSNRNKMNERSSGRFHSYNDDSNIPKEMVPYYQVLSGLCSWDHTFGNCCIFGMP